MVLVMSTLKISKLSKSYNKKKILNSFSLDVKSSEFVSLLGPSGCGKTTILKIISGFITPDSGNVKIDEIDVTNLPPEYRDTAMCFQSYALFPHLNVRENIEFGLIQKKISIKEAKHRLEEAVQHLSLFEELKKYPNQLSGGQQQRVALGRALVTRPSIILFDEPLSNLDAILRVTIRNEIKRIQSDFNLTAIYVTHDQSEALSISDRVVLLKDGIIQQIDKPEALYDKPNTTFVASFVGSSNIHSIKQKVKISKFLWEIYTNIGKIVVELDKDKDDLPDYICWRPENAEIGKASLNSFNGLIDSVSFQGGTTEIEVTVGGSIVKIVSGNRGLKRGEHIQFGINPKKIHFLYGDNIGT
tara:strand:+ start:411 stop:1484 length:1074 start_codon:yes stop_codon:yes gene_type:complete